VVRAVSRRNLTAAKKILNKAFGSIELTENPLEVVRHPDIDIVVELIGGVETPKNLVLEAMAHGKHVVTANKALLAEHGNLLFATAQAQGLMLAFEAAIAGGIPIIKAVREGLSANHIHLIAGIVNGTTNFIMSEMRNKSIDFATALKQAQELGFAEADPSFDLDGTDATHKISLLSAMAFGIPIQFSKAYKEGISNISPIDIKYIETLGYRIKLLAITKRMDTGIELRVHPCLIPSECLLANVEGPMNAVLVQGDIVGSTMYYGQGAGGNPTASSVIADLIDVTRLHTVDPEHHVPHLAFQPKALNDIKVLPIEEVQTSYYLRLRVTNQIGVLATTAAILAEHQISIESVLQFEEDKTPIPHNTGEVDLVILTNYAQESMMNAAITKLQQLPSVCHKIVRIRKEELQD
jgi:homoserine dehydrogenase